jgi:hypothetical protein
MDKNAQKGILVCVLCNFNKLLNYFLVFLSQFWEEVKLRLPKKYKDLSIRKKAPKREPFPV